MTLERKFHLLEEHFFEVEIHKNAKSSACPWVDYELDRISDTSKEILGNNLVETFSSFL